MARSEAQKKADKKYEEKRKGKRHKIWWGYLYPESAPDNWQEEFRELCVEGLACLHDKDTTATGEIKKSHYHVAVRFSHMQTREYAVEVLSSLGVLPASIQYRESWRAVSRYMIHADDPDKYQYAPENVIEVGGADWFDAVHRSSDKYKVISEMQDFITQENILSFATFFDYCRENNYDWFTALCDNCAIIIREYIKSKRYDHLESKAIGK